jgi:hypothetical protein
MGDWRSEEKIDTVHQEITEKVMMLALVTPFATGRCSSLPREFFSLDWCLLMGDPLPLRDNRLSRHRLTNL